MERIRRAKAEPRSEDKAKGEGARRRRRNEGVTNLSLPTPSLFGFSPNLNLTFAPLLHSYLQNCLLNARGIWLSGQFRLLTDTKTKTPFCHEPSLNLGYLRHSLEHDCMCVFLNHSFSALCSAPAVTSRTSRSSPVSCWSSCSVTGD